MCLCPAGVRLRREFDVVAAEMLIDEVSAGAHDIASIVVTLPECAAMADIDIVRSSDRVGLHARRSCPRIPRMDRSQQWRVACPDSGTELRRVCRPGHMLVVWASEWKGVGEDEPNSYGR